ncbi:hypothetical protein C8F04DRAFT_1182004 [Mycena alexandri]|uniref:Uncharacterized protein n=1 Tax=Mycena alexandri TaxID=1745969 RepID=A0AAD6SXA3_9AGAR|nr:hypothetical protein C8F04DRAFT_1182004 [Mycena alexandri]
MPPSKYKTERDESTTAGRKVEGGALGGGGVERCWGDKKRQELDAQLGVWMTARVFFFFGGEWKKTYYVSRHRQEDTGKRIPVGTPWPVIYSLEAGSIWKIVVRFGSFRMRILAKVGHSEGFWPVNLGGVVPPGCHWTYQSKMNGVGEWQDSSDLNLVNSLRGRRPRHLVEGEELAIIRFISWVGGNAPPSGHGGHIAHFLFLSKTVLHLAYLVRWLISTLEPAFLSGTVPCNPPTYYGYRVITDP